MPYPEDIRYFSYRMDEELERGDQATENCAGAIHYELAVRYGILAAQCAAGVSSVRPELERHSTPQIILDAVAAA